MPRISVATIYRAPASRRCTTPGSTRGSRANGSKSSHHSDEAAPRHSRRAAFSRRRWGSRARRVSRSGRCCRRNCSTAPESYVLEARDGSLLSARIASDGQWRFPARSTVPEKFRRALLTFEDKRFYEHSGVDGLAIARALRINAQAGRVREWRQHHHHAVGTVVARREATQSLQQAGRGVAGAAHRGVVQQGPDPGDVRGARAVRRQCGGTRGRGVAIFRPRPRDAVMGGGGYARRAAQQSVAGATQPQPRTPESPARFPVAQPASGRASCPRSTWTWH